MSVSGTFLVFVAQEPFVVLPLLPYLSVYKSCSCRFISVEQKSIKNKDEASMRLIKEVAFNHIVPVSLFFAFFSACLGQALVTSNLDFCGNFITIFSL